MAELVSKVYSEALFNFAKEENSVERVQNEFQFVMSCFETYPDFYEIFRTPRISVEQKKSVIDQVFENQISINMIHFLKILMDKRRGNAIIEIKRAFDKRVDDYHDIAKIVVESVVPLSKEQVEKLTKKIAIETGKNIEVQTQINKDLIGGVVIRMEDQVIDGSVKYKLEGMLEGLTQIII